MRLTRVVLACLVSVGSLLGAAYFATRTLRPPLGSTPPRNTITAVIYVEGRQLEDASDGEVPPGAHIVGVPRKVLIIRKTNINIEYQSPLDVSATADIKVELKQEEERRRVAGPGNLPTDYYSPLNDTESKYFILTRLPFDIMLRMEGVGLEWTEQNIRVKSGTPLPFRDGWAPRAKDPGDYVLRFPLRDINRAAESQSSVGVSDNVGVTVNGQTESRGGSDDVTLPLTFLKYDMSARTIDWLNALWTVFLGLFGTAAFAKALKWFMDDRRKDKGRPAH